MGISTIKWLGMIVLIIACVMTGFSMSDRVKRHYSHLKMIDSMLNEIDIMLRYNACTLNELFSHLKSCSELKKLDFLHFDFGSTSDLREAAVKKIDETSMELSEEEKDNLSAFFRELGSTDIEGQLAIVNHYKEYFNSRAAYAYEECGTKCRLYKSLGALGGAFLAVIII